VKPAEVSSLVPHLRCPLCGQRFVGVRADAVRADMKCQRPGCPQHWWAMALVPGLVLPQLEEAVGELAPILLGTYQLPLRLDAPMFWQLSLSGREARERDDVRRAGRAPDPVPAFIVPRVRSLDRW
jgi:hypothetical protein